MQLALEASRNGIFSLADRQGLIANNLANLDTPAFKRVRQVKADMTVPGTRAAATPVDFTQGDLVSTGKDLDLAIDGEGFFTVLRGGTTAYTRAGSFEMNRDGYLMTPQGDLLDPAIVVPPETERIEIGPDGTLYSVMDGGSTSKAIGRLDAVRFQNPQGLIPIGENLFLEGPDSGQALTGTFGEQGFPSVRQRFLERSNVDLTEEVTEQLLTQRAFQANVRAFQVSDGLIGSTLDLFR